MKFSSRFNLVTTHLIYAGNNEYVIVDPGIHDFVNVTRIIHQNNGKLSGVILSHEHADNCAGVNVLYEFSPFNLFCSKKCAENIGSSFQNLSIYNENIPAFNITIPATIVSDFQKVKIGKTEFTFIETPGHSPGSMCILSGNAIYTGDTLLNKLKVPLNFPHCNNEEYAKSVEKLKKIIKPGMMVFPGRGKPFEFITWSVFKNSVTGSVRNFIENFLLSI